MVVIEFPSKENVFTRCLRTRTHKGCLAQQSAYIFQVEFNAMNPENKIEEFELNEYS